MSPIVAVDRFDPPRMGVAASRILPVLNPARQMASNGPGFRGKGIYGLSRHKLILIVDDDDLVRRVVADLLEDLEFAVVEAASGDEALRVIENRRDVDLVISDVNMPRMDGLTLTGEIRTVRPALPVILMSGRRYLSGTCCFLPKPFTREELLDAIGRAMAAATQHADCSLLPP